METTIAAISTAMSASGIGIVRISGEDAMNVISRIYCMCCRELPTSYWICAVHLVSRKLGCRRKAGFGVVD